MSRVSGAGQAVANRCAPRQTTQHKWLIYLRPAVKLFAARHWQHLQTCVAAGTLLAESAFCNRVTQAISTTQARNPEQNLDGLIFAPLRPLAHVCVKTKINTKNQNPKEIPCPVSFSRRSQSLLPCPSLPAAAMPRPPTHPRKRHRPRPPHHLLMVLRRQHRLQPRHNEKAAPRGGLFSIHPRMIWCGREDSNFHVLRHSDLNAARLPIPPRPHAW